MRLRYLALTAALLTTTLAARADTIYSYAFGNTTGNFGLNGTVTGAVTIDVSTGTVQGISFTTHPVSGSATNPATSMTFSGVDSQVPAGFGPVIYVGGDGSAVADSTEAKLSLDAGSLINYNTGSDNAFDLRLPNGDAYVGHLINGSPVTIVPTPEPSGLTLLGTGLLGIVGVVRKRFRM